MVIDPVFFTNPVRPPFTRIPAELSMSVAFRAPSFVAPLLESTVMMTGAVDVAVRVVPEAFRTSSLALEVENGGDPVNTVSACAQPPPAAAISGVRAAAAIRRLRMD